MTIRISADERARIQALAEANDESEAQWIRRAIRLGLAVVVVPVLAVLLAACGTPDAPSAPQATVPQTPVAQVQDVPEASEAQCWSYDTDKIYDRFNEAAKTSQEAAIEIFEALPDPSQGCTDRDREILAHAKQQAEDSRASMASAAAEETTAAN